MIASRPDQCDTPPLPLLITGLAGVAGYNAFHYFRARFGQQVLAIRRPDHWPLQAPGVLACDGESRDDLARLFDEHQFRSVLYCGGSCALKSCELDPPMAWRVNVHGVAAMLDVIDRSDTRLVFSSIDLVYSGAGRGGYEEHAPTDPVTVYGKTMQVAERTILRRRPSSAILRISLPMGVSFNGHAGAIDWIQNRFRQNKPATLYFDEIRTPTYADCLNRVFQQVLARGSLRGVFHAGGPRRLSLYQIAQIVNRVGGYDPRHLMGCPRADAGPMPPRAGNVALDSSRLADALGYQPFDPWPLDPSLAPTHDQWHHERPADWPGSPEFLRQVLYRNPAWRASS